MSDRRPRWRPRPRSLRSGAFCVLALAALGGSAGTAAAQEPDTVPVEVERPRPPTLPGLPRDTLTRGLPGDTAAADTLPAPPPTLPGMARTGPSSPARGVWEWDREALRRLPALSLLHLLERLPGVVAVRADIVNQAEGASIFGANAGAVRYVVDGFELDPLTGPTFDPSRLALLGLERVRIERRVTGATVYVETLSPTEPSPRTIIEAGAGDYDVQLFRGIFLAPSVLGGPLALGFERLAADGATGGSSNHTAGWAKWSWIRDSAGLQLEYRQGDMERSGVGEGAGLNGIRRDWVVRGRAERGRLTGEVYAGASRVEDERGGVVIREGTPHGGLRLRTSLTAPVPIEARTVVRFRDHPRLPFGEVELGVRAVPFPRLAVEAEAARQLWDEGAGTGSWTARAQAGPLAGVTLFSEVFGGAPFLDGGFTLRSPSAYPGAEPLRVNREGVRAGAELRWRGASVVAAALRATADAVPGFALPFEPSSPRLEGGEATGYEVMARVPTGWDPLSIQGWYVGMDAPTSWLYLPAHHWRAGLTYHHVPLPSGNLEIFGRLEHVFRGRMTVPGVLAEGAAEGADPPAPALAEVGAVRETNFELAIRVISVQAFVRWDNIMNRRGQRDLLQLERPGQRILYGVKWEFVN